MTHRLRNLIHSTVLIGGMVVVLGALGQILAGSRGLLFLGVMGAVVLLLSPRISPYLMMRMYRARPLSRHETPRLMAAARELARRAGLHRAPALFYLPSRVVTAFTIGTRSDSAIAVSDGLLSTMRPRELVGVLAHEISHVANNDIWVMSMADLISRGTRALSLLGQFLLLLNLPLILMGSFRVPWTAILILIFAPTIVALLQLALSRTREYAADRGGAHLTGDPRGLASALAKLEHLNTGMFERIFLPGRRVPEPSLLRTHPHTEDRVRRLLEQERNLDDGGREQMLRPEPKPAPRFVIQPPRWHLTGLWY